MSKLNNHCNVGKTHFGTLCRRLMSTLKKNSIDAVRLYEEVHSLTFSKDNEQEENKVIKTEFREFEFAFKKDSGHWEARVARIWLN